MNARQAASEPYKGIGAFDVQDRHVFFGRCKESRALTELWRTQRLTVLYGASGIGKTSLLRAGVIPGLSPNKTDVLPLGRVSYASRFPRAALPPHNPHTLALLMSWSPTATPTRMAGMTIPAFFRGRMDRRNACGHPMSTLIAIDQVEELFTHGGHILEQRDWFFEQLAEALHTYSGLRLLLSIRADCLIDLQRYERDLAGGDAEHFRLDVLSYEGALAATRKPVEGIGRAFADGAVDRVVNDLIKIRARSDIVQDIEGVEPTQLQVVCQALWNTPPVRTAEFAGTEVIQYADGAADEILCEHYGRALREIAAERFEDNDSGLRTWLRHTFTGRTRGRRLVRHDSARAATSGRTMTVLVKRHLVRADQRMGKRLYELAYDRLIEPAGWARGSSRRRQSFDDCLRRAEGALLAGELTLAARHGERALIGAENDCFERANAASLLGDVAHARGQLRQAISHYTSAAQDFETAGAVSAVGPLLTAIGRLRLAQGRPSEAVRELRGAMVRAPTDLAIQTGLAWALWHSGHPAAAVGVLDSVLVRDSTNADALLSRGQILAGLDRAEDALLDLDLATPLRRPFAKIAHALALARTGKMEMALKEKDEALTQAGAHGPLLLYAARVEELAGRMAPAVALARRAISATAPALPRHLHQDARRLLDTE
ncbi:tetratricopeptide repeat protein [Nonomuraea glycinis]|uniref:tetratricopeptide repeat protein n=1 Tax=Nonomuraea glycinis TaxID=2047744 RepID=UPI0033B4B4F7